MSNRDYSSRQSKRKKGEILGENLPSWWTEVNEEFIEHYDRPFQPPRFSDGPYLHQIIAEIEEKYNIEISFITYDPEPNDDWEVIVNGSRIGKVPRHRERTGYSTIEITSKEFADVIDTAQIDKST